ncbi:MAG: enoyl-CoA hydratase/isomerase family protein [Vicinamibacterales bacterium]
MSSATTQFWFDGPLAFFTFNRPEALNAMTWEMYEALADACERVDRDADVRVFILRGAGGDAFVAGTDIRQFASFRSGDDGVAYERRIDAVVDRLERVVVPTIAQVEGVAAGGGCVIALACDLRVCTPKARFGVPIARTLGNCLSAANYARFIDLIGPARTKDLLFTGRFVDVAEAQQIGLVTRLASPDVIDDVTRELASDIALNAPLTIKVSNEAIRRISVRRRLEALETEDLIARCYGSDDFREGVTSFLEKRRPRFSGR